MRKLFSLIIASAMLIAVLSNTQLSVCAMTYDTTYEKIISETTNYFEDGSFITILVSEGPITLSRTAMYSKSGSKHFVFYDKDKVELWRFTVHGTFTVNPNISATCIEDSYDIISDSAWQNESVSTYHSGNQAIGDAVFIEKYLFITIDTVNCNVVLSCDNNGNLS